jgi:hypothetical protein
MAEPKPTPGPWFVEDRFADGDNGVLAVDGFRVAEATTWQSRMARNHRLVRRDISVEEQIANIHLIAAAPELLEALRFVLAHAFEAKWAGDERALELVEAAIAKAEGRADG